MAAMGDRPVQKAFESSPGATMEQAVVNPTSRQSKVLLVDPDRGHAGRLESLLRDRLGPSWTVGWSDRMPRADVGSADVQGADVVLLELPAAAGMPELTRVKELGDRVPIVVVSQRYNPTLATEALRVGAQDFVALDSEDDRIVRAIQFAVERHRLQKEIMESWRGDRERAKAVDSIQQIERLKQVNDFKTQLLNTAAHELSTPLTPIRFQAAILKKSDLSSLDGKQRKALDILDRNVDRLSRLVHDVLDVARLESRQFKIQVEQMDLSKVAAETAEAFRELAKEAQVGIELHARPSLMIEADPQRVAQVFFNLISNALKFTPAGGSVSVTTEMEGDMAIVHVKDTGAGLKKEDFQRLFQPFSQIEDPNLNTPKRGGTGLGLYISHGVVEQHGGRIWCDSPGPGQGATFSFALPIESPKRPQATVDTPDKADGNGAAEPAAHRRGVWPFIYFHCPMCDSRDIDMRLIRNIYQCNRCSYVWR